MSLQKAYYNQDLIWTPAQRNLDGTTKKDGSGRTLYGPPQTIRGWLQDRFKKITGKDGAEIVSSGVAKMDETVLIDDKINGRQVISSAPSEGFAGENEGRTVYLK
jgi:hypothetical protein